MKLIFGVIFLICCLSFTEGHKAKKHNKKDMKEIQKELDDLDVKIAKLLADTALIEECIQTPRDSPNWDTVCVKPEEERTNVSDLANTNLDVFWAANMYMNNGDRCASRVSRKYRE